jgi:predicted enzyme related to lactoylglutathione lyase
MSIKFHGLRTAGYYVADINAAKEWYTKVLGIAPYFDEPFYVGFNVGGYELGLQPTDHTGDVSLANVVAYWGVDDVRSSYATMIQHGAAPMEEPADVGGDIVVAAVKDPWGNAFGLIYNPHFGLDGNTTK